jgi:thymidylate synthase
MTSGSESQVRIFWSETRGAQLHIMSQNPEETAYLESLRGLLALTAGPNRTNTPTRTAIHTTLRFDLSGGRFPLLTTKRMALRSIFYELMWFLRGDTDTTYLREHDVTIWDGNTSVGALTARGLNKPEGYVGPSYGNQWRTWGGRGCDQIRQVMTSLAEDPWSRRHVVSTWNPPDLERMALPPCHYCFQFVVGDCGASPRELSCVVNMRSADAALGVPFNIASYALLTHIFAEVLGYSAGSLILSCANYHMYESHAAAVSEQVSRCPREFPRLTFRRPLRGMSLEELVKLSFVDLEVLGYDPHPRIPMVMVV